MSNYHNKNTLDLIFFAFYLFEYQAFMIFFENFPQNRLFIEK